MKIKDRVFGQNVSSDIIKEFKRLSGGGLSGIETLPLESRNPTFEKYLGDRTTFARMWTAVNTYTSGSNPEETSKNSVYIVNENRENSYDVNPNEEIGETVYKSQLSNNPYLKPPAGITSISSKTEGSLGVLKRTSVDFIVHNKKDFEDIFLPFFLRPGARVCLDFGWSDEKSISLYNPTDQIKNKDLKMQHFDTFIYGGVDDDGKEIIGFLNNPSNKGLVNTIMGDVVNYDAKLNALGSFECSLEVISRNTSLLDKEVSEENGLKYVFTNFIEDYLLQMFIYRIGVDNKELAQNMDAFRDVVDDVARNKLFDDLNRASPTSVGNIDRTSSELGFFYQDLTDGDGAGENKKEMIYINYGLFEDFFINNIVVKFKDENNKSVNSPNIKSQVKYDSRDSYVRYVEELKELQKLPLTVSDDLPTFLYNEIWENSYNKKTRPKDEPNYKDLIKEKKVPIREIFISVPLIKQSFESANNINDALTTIFQSINENSYDVFNIQMTSNNDSDTSICFQDINIMPPLEEGLVFDVTSDTSIVTSADLTFKTPKNGLSSMIAIQNLSTPSVLTQGDLSNFNMLNILKKDESPSKKTIVRSLPISSADPESVITGYGDVGLSSNDVELFSNNLGKVSNPQVGDEANTRWEMIKDVTGNRKQGGVEVAIGDYYKDLIKAKEEAEEEEKEEGKKDDQNQKENQKDSVVIVNTRRELFGQMANRNHVLKSGTNTVSPILPVDLTLSVYGNTYLTVGDTFSVNFLPRHYQDRVYFQTVGIDHKLSTSGWETTYNTVMRIRPEKKKVTYGPENLGDKASRIEIKASKPLIKEQLLTKNSLDVDESIADTVDKLIINRTIGKYLPSQLRFTISTITTDILEKIGKKKITSKYNPYALQLNFAKNGLKSEYNISLLYALTTLLIPNDKTDERYNLNMDLFKKSYLGSGDSLNQKYKSKFKADTDNSVVQFMVNNMTGKEGKAGILLNTIDSDFDQPGMTWGLDEKQKEIVKFTEILQENYNFVDTKFQFAGGSLPILNSICYNLKNVDTYYQSEISHDSGGKFDTIVIIPRLMKNKNFGVGDVEAFCKELAQRQTEFEYISFGRDVPGGLHSRDS
jgi:hypothetical protein